MLKEKIKDILYGYPESPNPCGEGDPGSMDSVVDKALYKEWRKKHPHRSRIFYDVPGWIYIIFLLAIVAFGTYAYFTAS